MNRRRRTRQRRRIAAISALLALGASVFTASAAAADNDAFNLSSPKGYVSSLRGEQFTVSGTTLSGPMPGNVPGQVTFSTATTGGRAVAQRTGESPATSWAPNQPLLLPGSETVLMNSLPSAVRNCLPSYAAGALARCETSSVVLTFPQPVVDPIIVANAAATRIQRITLTPEDALGCLISFNTLGIGKINGATPKSGQVSLSNVRALGPGDWSYTFDSTTNQVVPSGRSATPPAGICNPTGGYTSAIYALQVRGLVSSVQVDLPIYESVVKPLASTFFTGNQVYWIRFPLTSVGFGIPSADLRLSKEAPATAPAGGAITWKLTISNSPTNADSHGFVIKDAIPANVANPQLVDPPPGCALSGRDLVCGVAPPGYSVARPAGVADTNMQAAALTALSGTDTSSVGTVLAAGDAMTVSFTGTAPSTPTTITNTAYVYGADVDRDTTNNSGTSTTTVNDAAAWNVTKSATVGGAVPAGGIVKPGDVITYTVTTTSTRGAVSNAVISDDLSGVLGNAAFKPGSAQLNVGGSTVSVADPTGTTLTTPSFTLPDGGSATLSYQVTVNSDAWLSTLTNRVTATGSTPPSSCDPCSTTHKTGSLVLVQKNGIDATGHAIGVDGAAFQVHSDAGGQPGAVVAGTRAATVPGQAGAFRIEGLMPGSYWLRETAAPEGYALLPQPIAFTIGTTGTVTLGNPAANPNVTASGRTLTVSDAPAMVLPPAGGRGAGLAVGVGAATLAGALLLALVARARSGGRPSRAWPTRSSSTISSRTPRST